MHRIITKSIKFQCDNVFNPREMILIFSEYDNIHAKQLCNLLDHKGIIYSHEYDYIEYMVDNSEETYCSENGLLILLSKGCHSYYMTMDEAIDWAKSLPFGRIIIEKRDYTPISELYAAYYCLEKELHYDVDLFIPGEDIDDDTKVRIKRREEEIDRVSGLLEKMQFLNKQNPEVKQIVPINNKGKKIIDRTKYFRYDGSKEPVVAVDEIDLPF